MQVSSSNFKTLLKISLEYFPFVEDCKLQLPKLSFFAPLVFDPEGTLKTTETNGDDNFVRIASDENIILSCAPNYFKNVESKFLNATCKGNDILGKL